MTTHPKTNPVKTRRKTSSRSRAMLRIVLWLSLVFSIGAGVEQQLRLEVMVVAGPDGAELQAGRLGYAEIKVTNLGNVAVGVPLSPRGLGKGADSRSAPAYKATPEWWYSGFAAPRIAVQFVDAGGDAAKEFYPLTLPDVVRLEPGGWTTLRCLFLSPESPGTYTVRFSFDTRDLKTEPTHNDFEDQTVLIYLNEEVSAANVSVVAPD